MNHAELSWTLDDGRTVVEEAPLAETDDTLVLRIPSAAIRAKRAKRLAVTPDFGRAEKGEGGWWFSPGGHYGEFDRENGLFLADGWRMGMPMFGWATPRGAWLAVVTSLPCYPQEEVAAKGGRYRVSCVLGEELCRDPYEDFEIAFFRFPAGTDYCVLAKRYREYQLSRGVVSPLKERAADNPALAYAVEAPEIRIRMAWKPVPSPLPNQQPENEPPVHVAATFDRVKDIVRELKAQGVEKAELCLVGWNIGGHDGRWPQAFPAEPLLGGDAKLRELVAFARGAGYQIVPHGNFRDAYAIADCWDAEWTIKNADGSLLPRDGGSRTWGGGMPYAVCPQRAYEKFCTKDMPRMATFGFRGLAYFDVVSVEHAPQCRDPRHPCSFADGARYWGLCADIARREFGGFASEGLIDHFAGSLDSALYASLDSPEDIRAKWERGEGLPKGHVPIAQIVYNGIVLQNPFSTTVNFTAQSRRARLKLLEYGGRPSFYFHSKFMANGTDWMGDGDLRCGTDDELKSAVAKIKEGLDIYRRVSHLQYEFVDGHDKIADGAWRTTWSNGERLYVNYTDLDVVADGIRVPAMDWILHR